MNKIENAFLLLVLYTSSWSPLDGFGPGREKTSTVTAFVHQPKARTSSSPSLVVRNSFSRLGDLGLEDSGSPAVTTGTVEPQLQPSVFPLPPPPQPALQWQEDSPKQFYEEVSLPAPPLITNPYDGATTSSNVQEEQIVPASPQVFPITKVAQAPETTAITTLNTNPSTSVNRNVRNIWETSAPTVIQGDSIKTWDFRAENMEAVQVLLKTNGRPLHANVELWQGEDHIPQKISVYTEDGEARPFSAFLATPYHGATSIAVKNSANMEFPLKACVEGDLQDAANGRGYGASLAQTTLKRIWESASPKVIQGGGASKIFPFDESVARIQLMITNEMGTPVNARIELLQGPNNVKQVIEVSTEDGQARPFFAVLETPGLANALRIVNQGPFEFPIDCRVEPFFVVDELEDDYFFDTPAEQQATDNWSTSFLDKVTSLWDGSGSRKSP